MIRRFDAEDYLLDLGTASATTTIPSSLVLSDNLTNTPAGTRNAAATRHLNAADPRRVGMVNHVGARR